MTEEIKIPTLQKGYEVEERILILRTYSAPFHQLENEEIIDTPYPILNCPPDHVLKNWDYDPPYLTPLTPDVTYYPPNDQASESSNEIYDPIFKDVPPQEFYDMLNENYEQYETPGDGKTQITVGNRWAARIGFKNF